MLPGIINEKGNCLDVRDDISERNDIRQTYESLASGAFILGIVVIVDECRTKSPPDKTPPAHFCIRGQNPPHEFYN